MKKLKVVDQKSCMACLECEKACSLAFYKSLLSDLSCIHIVAKKGTREPKTNVCIQCGKCAKVCEAGAIKQNAKGVWMIDKKLCTGCGKCVEICPMKVMVKAEDSPVTTKCIACGLCAKACPMGVLEIVES